MNHTETCSFCNSQGKDTGRDSITKWTKEKIQHCGKPKIDTPKREHHLLKRKDEDNKNKETIYNTKGTHLR